MMNVLKEAAQFALNIYREKSLIYTLSADDFRQQYLGSYLGMLWAVLRPVIFVLTIWLVFTVGFKRQPDAKVPFILYLICGYAPWVFFADCVNGGMNSVVNNRHLVKKVDFRVSILPLVKIISSFYLHLVFLAIIAVIAVFKGFYPTIYWIQIPFYLSCVFVLTLGIGWLTGAVRVFTKDMSQIIQVVLQTGFWVTPIFWNASSVPEKYRIFLYLNPMVYVVEGYRNVFISGQWFFHDIYPLAIFVCVSLFFLLSGVIAFKKLRPHFAEVL
ncbi:MAG: ABC transporter permease [Deferribacterales bacterium]